MISAKKYHSAEQLDSIVTRIKNERKQTAKPRKASARKKKRVQVSFISHNNYTSAGLAWVTEELYYHSFYSAIKRQTSTF